MKILIIEDDEDLSLCLKSALSSEFFIVDIARDGRDGSRMACNTHYDMIILDYELPFKNGAEICREIRTKKIDTPIIFLTVHKEIAKKITSLNDGADDYITKPFSIYELKARIEAVNRRPRKIESCILKAGNIILDTKKQIVKNGDKIIYLTKKEYVLLEYLMRNSGTILSRTSIMEYVWDMDNDTLSNTVESHILNLRKKINTPNGINLIRNVSGLGYVIDAI